jgi:4-amino-4-deoxy-L-arabinose transferase-like glycosyltransferase
MFDRLRMTTQRNNRFIILSLIVLIGACIRGLKLGTVPAGFFCDEASFGVNAYSILKTGTDEFGTRYPLFFRSFGDYKEAIPTYSIVPFVYLFGLHEWSVRLMSVAYGLANLLLLYAVGTALRDPRLGLLAACTGATMPWMFHYDRVAFHSGPYLCTLLCAIFFLFTARNHHPLRICGFFIFAGLSLYTYSPSKLMAPLLMLSAVCIYWRYFIAQWHYLIVGILMLGVIANPLVEATIRGQGLARVEQLRLLDVSKFSFETLANWLRNYEIQLLPSTLFVQGEPTIIKRHLTNFFPPLLIATAPFLVAGIAQLARGAARPEYAFLLVALALFPLGATLTGDPFTLRSVLGAPLCAICIALGLEFLIFLAQGNRERGRLLIALTSLLGISVNAGFYVHRYLTTYPITASDFYGWQYGPREIIQYFREHSSDYDELIVQGEFNSPEIFFKFYAADGLCAKRCSLGDFSRYDPNKRQLFAATPAMVAGMKALYNLTHQSSVRYPNGNPAFLLTTINGRAPPPNT